MKRTDKHEEHQKRDHSRESSEGWATRMQLIENGDLKEGETLREYRRRIKRVKTSSVGDPVPSTSSATVDAIVISPEKKTSTPKRMIPDEAALAVIHMEDSNISRIDYESGDVTNIMEGTF